MLCPRRAITHEVATRVLGLIQGEVGTCDDLIERARLLAAYRTWAQRNGEHTLSAKAFASALKRRGITDGGKSGNTRYWTGITLTEEPAQIDEPF